MAKLRIYNPTIESLHAELAEFDDDPDIELIYAGYITSDIEQAIAINNYCEIAIANGINLTATIMGICSSAVIVATGPIPIKDIYVGEKVNFMFFPPKPTFGGSVEEIVLSKKNHDVIHSCYEELMSSILNIKGSVSKDKRLANNIITGALFKEMRG